MKRLCIFCRFFYFESGSPGYSEMTPGSEADMGCYKNIWLADMRDYDFDFNATLKTAQSCEFYERSQDAIEMGAPK